MNDFLKNKVHLRLIQAYTQLAEEQFYKIPESLILICKDNLSNEEYKQYLLAIEAALKKKYQVSRMPILSKYFYILKLVKES